MISRWSGKIAFAQWLAWSERRDSNSRPPVPQTGALTGLRYAPTRQRVRRGLRGCKSRRADLRKSVVGMFLRRHARFISARRRDQAPHHAKQQERVAPVIDVDD